jgi:hypothetical protein
MTPSLTKTRHCPDCDALTEQKLSATREGASWRCTVCAVVTAVYTLERMRDLLRGTTPPAQARSSTIDPTKVKIFLAHPEGEYELSAHSVKRHLDIMGTVPKPGEPVFTRSDDAGSVTGLGLEVPYGQVTRVEILP